ncbi:MAG: hypothetical protein D6761_06425 [Candidatus Dadabacteria bacterium]|nr:MAG: hypothetical protein D6761_06425 [Candidatus Dadabacteria bacterium]
MGDISQLGYIEFEVSDPDAWERFGTNVLGLTASPKRDDGGYSFRLDSRRHRIFIRPGAADDLVTLGVEAADNDALERILERLRKNDVAYREAPPERTAARDVERLVLAREPGGVDLELYVGPAIEADAPDTPLVPSGFVAEDMGFGHVALRAEDLGETERFFCDILGFQLSDRIICRLGGMDINITFLHVNPRHHSIAFGAGLPKHIHHFMLQTRSIDDVGAAMDRTVDNGFELVQTMGRHPNDKMITFYGRTPSGFEFEFGAGGLSIDDSTWEVQTHGLVSEWGHRPPRAYARAPRGTTS